MCNIYGVNVLSFELKTSKPKTYVLGSVKMSMILCGLACTNLYSRQSAYNANFILFYCDNCVYAWMQ